MMRKLLLMIAAMALCCTMVFAQTVKVGVINTYSGPLVAVGDQMERGIKLYMTLHGKDLPPGVTIELIRRDDTGPNPDVAKRLAQELITRDKVQLLTGVIWTPNALAMAPLVTGSLHSGPPAYDMEIWTASALLSVTFPFLIFYAAYFDFWPLQKSK